MSNCRHPGLRRGEPRVPTAGRGSFPADPVDPLDQVDPFESGGRVRVLDFVSFSIGFGHLACRATLGN